MMSDHGTTTANDAADRMHAEACGVVQLVVVRKVDQQDLLLEVIGGDPDAARLVRITSQAATGIAHAPKHRPMLCATCPRPIRTRGAGHAYVVAIPACDDPRQTMCIAVCARCATAVADITAKAQSAFRKIWRTSSRSQ